MRHIDIGISGGDGGLYILKGLTDAGRDYINDNVPEAEDGDAEIESARYALEIADEAVSDDLEVTVHGKEYSGLLN